METGNSMKSIYVDQAGSVTGGAGRLRHELLSYLSKNDCPEVEVIGLHTRLTPKWLAQRELKASRAQRKIALNNASFMLPGGHKTVLLQNVIHFSTEAERLKIGYRAPKRIKAQIPVIRAGAKKADRIIVPTESMRERVERIQPGLAPKIEVRMLPLSVPEWTHTQPDVQPLILMPQVPQPYKPLDLHVSRIVAALECSGIDAKLVCTCRAVDLPRSGKHPLVICLGLLGHGELETWYRRARAVYFPTTFEAFGYPIAQARAGGRWVIAQDTDQNRQIAGANLSGYNADDLDTLMAAVNHAMVTTPPPDPAPFDPQTFFEAIF